MITVTQKAAAGTATPTNKQQNESYPNTQLMSSVKAQIGVLLLTLQTPLTQNQRKERWAQFESELKQYFDLKCMGVL